MRAFLNVSARHVAEFICALALIVCGLFSVADLWLSGNIAWFRYPMVVASAFAFSMVLAILALPIVVIVKLIARKMKRRLAAKRIIAAYK